MRRFGPVMMLLILCELPVTAQSAVAHHDPTLGRWLERDPIGTWPSVPPIGVAGSSLSSRCHDGLSLYEYVQAAPVIRSDPSGLCSFKIKCIHIALPNGVTVPASHCYLDFGDGDVCSAHNPPAWPKPGPITPYCGPWRTSPDKSIKDRNARPDDPLGPERSTLIRCPPEIDCKAAKKCIEDTFEKIRDCKIPYDPLGPNSNTSLWAVFQKCLVSRGCKLLSRHGDTSDRRPNTAPGAPPVGWSPVSDDRLKPIQDCLNEDHDDEKTSCDGS